jgi:hypothetical protein
MIVLRLTDGSLLVLLPDGQAVRVERDGTAQGLGSESSSSDVKRYD